MSILSTLAAYQTPLLLLLTIFGPSLLPFVTRRHTSSNQLPPQPPRSPLPPTIKALLILHTVYHIFQLLYPPYDLFVSHSIPIITSHASLRSTVLARAQTSTLHPSRTGKTHPLLELLLTRLQNLDTRLLYVRFGHRSLLTCVWCQDVNDFLLASLSGILGPYVGEAMVIGLMGWSWVGGGDAELRAASWRVGFAWGLGWMAVVEVGVRYLWDLRVVNGDCLHVCPVYTTLSPFNNLITTSAYSYPTPSTHSAPSPSSSSP